MLTLSLLLLPGCRSEHLPRGSGPLPEDAYVWQRAWGEAVRRAVSERAPSFRRLIALAAEVSFRGGQPEIARIPLEGLPRGSGLAVRVALPPEGYDTAGLLGPLLAEILSERPETSEVQIDLDMPTRRLHEHTTLVGELREQVAPIPLSATALPAWLSDPALRDLALAADGLVLQLHWLSPPRPDGSMPPLLDAEASAHVEEMARRAPGLPFRIALPTYGYAVLFDKDGQMMGVSAEQGEARPPEGGRVEILRADPRAVGALSSSLREDRPGELSGVLWFRLPVDTDRLAWSWPALQAVREGRAPEGRAAASLRQDASGSLTVSLRNEGDDDLAPPSLRVSGEIAIAEALAGYRWSRGEGVLSPAGALPLRPGEERAIGWFRGEGQHTISIGE